VLENSYTSCRFCKRPIPPEFAYQKPSAANAGLCSRKDCRKARKRAARPGIGPTVRNIPYKSPRQETRLESDATTESKAKKVATPCEIFVRADLDENVPETTKIRLSSGPRPSGASEVFDRAQRAAKLAAQHPAQPRRAVFNPPVNLRPYRGDDKKAADALEELVQRTEWKFKTREGLGLVRPAPQENTPSSERLEIDNIRNEWLKEKLETDNRVLLETMTPCSVAGVFSFRLSTGLSVQNLVAFIGDEKFTTTPAVSRREATFYKDYAKGEELTVELMVKRHGVWGDEEIVELENRIIRHAAAVGLLIRPPHMLPETDPLDGEELERMIDKTDGAEIGGRIHVKKRQDGRRRALTDFETPPSRTWVDPNKPNASPEARWWDDHSEDSSS
jgi:hypothetical protein